jgi:hypothetical protein
VFSPCDPFSTTHYLAALPVCQALGNAAYRFWLNLENKADDKPWKVQESMAANLDGDYVDGNHAPGLSRSCC